MAEHYDHSCKLQTSILHSCIWKISKLDKVNIEERVFSISLKMKEAERIHLSMCVNHLMQLFQKHELEIHQRITRLIMANNLR